MPDRQIFEATKANCVKYQHLSATFARDAVDYLERGDLGPARTEQEHCRQYSDLAQERLSRLIGTA